MKFQRKAASISIILALPFMFAASWFWFGGQKPSVYSDALYSMGDAIFQLGFPLTTTLYYFLLKLLGGTFTKESELWALPLINFAFLVQWIIWSQLIAWFLGKRRKLK